MDRNVKFVIQAVENVQAQVQVNVLVVLMLH